MRNKGQKKLFVWSLKKEFLLLSIVAFIIVISGIIHSINIVKYNSNESLINIFNKTYIDIQRYVNRLDDNSKKYLNEVCELNKVNAAIIDTQGNIYMKSKNVDSNIIDVNKIQNIFQNKYSDENIYQRYDISLDNEDYNLLIWREQGGNEVIIKVISSISLSFLLAIIIIYIYTIRKARYII